MFFRATLEDHWKSSLPSLLMSNLSKKKLPKSVATTQVLECGGRTRSQIPWMTFYDFRSYILDSAAPVDLANYMWISKYPWISQMKSPDITCLVILVRLSSRKKAGPRPPLSPGHAVHLLVDVIPMLLAFKGNWFQVGESRKSCDFGGIVSIDCWNMLKWYWKCPSIWLLWIDSLFQWDKYG